MLNRIAEVCASFGVDGLRADIVIARAAAAHAAWCGAAAVTREDIRAAARLALPHRRRRNPFDAPGLDEQQLDEALGGDEDPDDEPDRQPPDPGRTALPRRPTGRRRRTARAGRQVPGTAGRTGRPGRGQAPRRPG